MWRAAWIAASVTVCAGCERAAPTAKHVELDPCSLVTQNDATALLGSAALKKEAHRGDCAWGFELPDHSSSKLRVELQGRGFPVIIVAPAEITIDGKPYTPEPPTVEPVPIGQNGSIEKTRSVVSVKWKHDDLSVDLTLLSAGPSTFAAITKTEQMKRLAEKVEAAL